MNPRLFAWLENVSAQVAGTLGGGVLLVALGKLAGVHALRHVDWWVLVPVLLALAAGIAGLASIEWSGKPAAAEAARSEAEAERWRSLITQAVADAVEREPMPPERARRHFRAIVQLRQIIDKRRDAARRGLDPEQVAPIPDDLLADLAEFYGDDAESP